mmetsp:Transcript_22950/g.63887  ORF Transcript_22950/g.63887 Transcript_22950/m.63887 type:complete len:434 (+) Transcript_22950:39-1340(+)
MTLSGLAASIRGAVDSETFDLAGKSASTIQQAVLDTFKDPFPLEESIRITFVTGAGKLARQKYDDGAQKAITNNLRELGYEEDHGGGAGTFKLQHDTGKNLKTVVVYPNVVGRATGSEEDGTHLLDPDESSSLFPEGTAEHKIAFTSLNVFERVITSMCPSWLQKKGCVTAIDSIKAIVKSLDDKLMYGQPLEESEQAFYDEVSMSSLEDKQSLVRELMHKQVDDGRLLSTEKQQLLDHVSERLNKLEAEKAEAESQGKAKKAQNMAGIIEKATARKEKLESIVPTAPHQLKKQAEINKLRAELAPLLKLEASTKGRLLSVKESQSIARKEEIEEEIRDLEEASRGWFESDELFQARLSKSRISARDSTTTNKKKSAPPKGKGGGGTTPARTTVWSTPASRKAPAKPKAKSGRSQGGGGGVFAAMMMEDSDSD